MAIWLVFGLARNNIGHGPPILKRWEDWKHIRKEMRWMRRAIILSLEARHLGPNVTTLVTASGLPSGIERRGISMGVTVS